jgi:hypothetical protein
LTVHTMSGKLSNMAKSRSRSRSKHEAPLSVRIPMRLEKELIRRAERDHRSKSDYVRLVLLRHCEMDGSNQAPQAA